MDKPNKLNTHDEVLKMLDGLITRTHKSTVRALMTLGLDADTPCLEVYARNPDDPEAFEACIAAVQKKLEIGQLW